MTCREKLRLAHPTLSEIELGYILQRACPDDYGYLPEPGYCCSQGDACDKCWDREIPDTKDEIIDKINAVGETYPIFPEEVRTVIKDSGNRREFETGAVRDIQEGKGRCDLMPLEVVAYVISGGIESDDTKGIVLHNISAFCEKRDTYYLYLALTHFAERCYGRSIPTMFLEVAKHFEEGAKKYGENNWQKGIPVNCYIDSAIRHYLKWLRGDRDEPHDRAFVWNLMYCIWEVDFHKKTEETK